MYGIFYNRLIEDLSKWNFYTKIDKGCFFLFFFWYALSSFKYHLTTVESELLRTFLMVLLLQSITTQFQYYKFLHPSKSWRVVARNWFKTESVIHIQRYRILPVGFMRALRYLIFAWNHANRILSKKSGL